MQMTLKEVTSNCSNVFGRPYLYVHTTGKYSASLCNRRKASRSKTSTLTSASDLLSIEPRMWIVSSADDTWLGFTYFVLKEKFHKMRVLTSKIRKRLSNYVLFLANRFKRYEFLQPKMRNIGVGSLLVCR